MPFDLTATRSFGQNPYKFVQENFLKTAGQSTLSANATWSTLGGGAAARNFHEGTIGTLTLGGAPITQDGVLTVNSISNRTPPTCFVGLEPILNKANYYDARVQSGMATGLAEVLFLPARANQLSAILLPMQVDQIYV